VQDDVKEQNVQDDLANVDIEGADTPTAEKYRQRGMVPSVAARMAALVDDPKCACISEAFCRTYLHFSTSKC
jgi:hypothetical protein